ncbi:restriction endonuclease subunit S [Pirellulaceae bacterium SH467]
MSAISVGCLKKPLGDVANVISGYAFKSSEFGEQGIPVIKIKNIRVGFVDLSDADHVDEKYLAIPDRFHVRRGDILISLTGSHITQPNSVVGRVARHAVDLPRCLLNQRAGKIVVKDLGRCDANFLFYALSEQETLHAIAMKAHGAASQAKVSPSQVESIEIPLPRVPSPLGDIPKGWEVKTVQHFGKVITGKTPSKANADFYGEDVPFVKTPDMHGNMFILGTSERLSPTGAKSQVNKMLPAGTICVSCIGTIGVVSITTEDCQTNQQINSVVLENEVSREFLFLRLQDAKQTLENLGSNGATMGNVNKGKFETMEIVAPSTELLAEFHRLARSMFEEILVLSRQTQNLRRTRDLLLPRLLSGQIDVEAIAS